MDFLPILELAVLPDLALLLFSVLFLVAKRSVVVFEPFLVVNSSSLTFLLELLAVANLPVFACFLVLVLDTVLVVLLGFLVEADLPTALV